MILCPWFKVAYDFEVTLDTENLLIEAVDAIAQAGKMKLD
jgi:hypothetical protein